MTTARVIISDALKLLRVIAAEEEMEAVDLVDGLRWLNRKLHGLKSHNADLDFQDITEDEDVPIPPELDEPVVYMLASTLAPNYGTQLTPEVAVEARAAMATLQAYYRRNYKLRVDEGIHNREARYNYDITTDN